MVTLHVGIDILPDAGMHRSPLELNLRSSWAETCDSDRSLWFVGVYVLLWTFANILGTCCEVSALSLD